MPEHLFSALPLKPALLDALRLQNFTVMTPVQAAALPAALDGKDLIVRAETGSGKTAVFALTALQRLDPAARHLQALVLCPTRELAEQVAEAFRHLAKKMPNVSVVTLTGGTPLAAQAAALCCGAQIAVGTPGRIGDHLGKNTLDTEHVGLFVLDEADRMLQMGFTETVERIARTLKLTRQTLLFSATFPDNVAALARRLLHDPETVTVDPVATPETVETFFYRLDRDDERGEALIRLLNALRPESALIFCNTKAECKAVAAHLKEQGFPVCTLHGDLDQPTRNERLLMFENGSCPLLVATDVAARGLDVAALDCVVNCELPLEPEVFLHRIGRTGRAGRSGTAHSLVSGRDRARLERIETLTGMKPVLLPLPGTKKRVPASAAFATLRILGGKKHKLRPGDILGALTADGELRRDDIGKITMMPQRSYVAVRRDRASTALKKLENGKIKGKKFRAERVEPKAD